ncbi:acetylserotonin O-methyltransferase [Nocardia sp. NBC_01503]|uniref:methyltransferase n=1 Tax=Nocardia sp. NBC_01503 TaxID=2975997 RepID=UPI002E7B59A4|nr:methyltransferase [Nocardia sp. NBC_01503]WTL30252.1 acetylserotonin O-methyltransferase [Nocardia sp. NBC_01503]
MTRVSAVFVMPGLAPDDLVELDAALSFLHRHDTLSALTVMLPDLTAGERHAIAANCRLSHTALLLCPRDLAELTQALDERGLTAGPDIPSTVVRQRLAGRYGRPASRLDVRIVHAPVPVADDVDYTVEIFALLPVPGTRIDEIISAEREFGHERHVALAADTRDEVILNGLRALLIGRGRLHSDGGGYNPVEDVTVLYFRAGSEGQRPYRRLELRCGGKHPELMAAHLTASQDAPTRLLRLLTGAWATQALAVTVTLGVADQLAARPGYPIDELARDIAADPDALHRLLRYLRELGIVTPTPDGIGYTLTELGALLPVTAPQSLHPLARLYGGDFYESFGRLEYAVRTGQPAFDEHFGRHHFEYFSADPERAELFDAAMAASASIFGQIAQLIDLSAARTVVDVAGGNGALLAGLLRAAPHLRGILFERESTLRMARGALDRAGCLPQTTLVPGDFTAAIPGGGDLYFLSRVLHDWDDNACRAILRRCAEAMPAHASLYVIERVLPEDDSPSLAPAWDVHMLCNVGGRERTVSHFRDLLGGAGLRLHETQPLAMDFVLLRATRQDSATG